MKTFDLLGTPAENDVYKYFGDKIDDVIDDASSLFHLLGSGILVVKNGNPQLFLEIPESDIDNWQSVIRIDPENAEEIRQTTDVYFGSVNDELTFLVDKKLF